MRILACLFGLLMLLLSCSRDDMNVADDPDKSDTSSTDTIAEDTLVSFKNEIEPILKRRNCVGCHSERDAQGGVILSPFENLKLYVDNGKFLSAIKHEAGVEPMPYQRPKMPESEIELISKWIEEGALNN